MFSISRKNKKNFYYKIINKMQICVKRLNYNKKKQ